MPHHHDQAEVALDKRLDVQQNTIGHAESGQKEELDAPADHPCARAVAPPPRGHAGVRDKDEDQHRQTGRTASGIPFAASENSRFSEKLDVPRLVTER